MMQHKTGRGGGSGEQFGIPDCKSFEVDSSFWMQHRAGGREAQGTTEKEIGTQVKRHSETVPHEGIPTQQMVNENKKWVSPGPGHELELVKWDQTALRRTVQY